MKRLGLVLMATVGLASLAHAADVPTKKAPEPAPAVKPNCWGNYGWNWLNSSPDDCPLSYAGITLYGTLDVGLGYQQWGADRSPTADKVNYGPAKSSWSNRFMATYNGMSTSVVGLKMKEDLAPIGLAGWSLVGVLEAGVQPYSGMFLNPPRSLADNNLLSPTGRVVYPATNGTHSVTNGKPYYGLWQSANFNSSRNGSWDNSQGYIGISNNTWGTLTFGRTNSLTNDVISKYDPVSSIAFSMVGFSNSFAGFGDTQLVRINTALTYKVAIPHVGPLDTLRLAGQAQIGGYGMQNGSMGAYYGQIGFDYGNLSFDGVVGWAKDAVSLSSFNGANNAICGPGVYGVGVNNACYNSNDVIKATLSNNFGTQLTASYKYDRFRFYGGYIYANLSNPSDQFLTGFTTNYTGLFVPPGYLKGGVYTNDALTSNNFNYNRVLQTAWTGVKWSVLDNVDLAIGYYFQWQNNFNSQIIRGTVQPLACTGQGAFISSTKCAGTQSALSFFVDYKPTKRIDIYAGVMDSNVYGGLAQGYFNYQQTYNPVTKQLVAVPHAFTNFLDPTVGVRIRF